MPSGFYWLISAQFFSALADHVSLFIGIYLLQHAGEPSWKLFFLKASLLLFYVLLAPFVGPWADRYSKNRVMFVANLIKLCGAISLLIEPSVVAFLLIGMGAALYAPAKFGLLTEMVPSTQLIRANGWIETTLILAVILGTTLGGFLASETFNQFFLSYFRDSGQLSLVPGLVILLVLYLVAAALNVGVPNSVVRPDAESSLQRFALANRTLWSDAIARIALIVTMLIWIVSAGLQLVMMRWLQQDFSFSITESAYLQGATEIAVAIGAFLASRYIQIQNTLRVTPLAYMFGGLVILVPMLNHIYLVSILMLAVGVVLGLLVVPMNALLQHRGVNLLSPGESIAVQNFNECLAILVALIILAVAHTSGVSPRDLLINLGFLTLIISLLVGWMQRVTLSNVDVLFPISRLSKEGKNENNDRD
jgi:LPLT family lysophospholipid transporter-like MFS transporter